MYDKKFFSHYSPTLENKTFKDRILKAGYKKPGGENIATGYASAERVFWAWFLSSGHHKNMLREQFSSLGVGTTANLWTQNFGCGKRLMYQEK